MVTQHGAETARRTPRRVSRGGSAGRRMEAYAYLTPTLVVMAVMMAVPIVTVLIYSLYNNVITDPNPVFIGLGNYRHLFSDPTFWQALRNTVVFTALSVGLHLVLGMAFALLLNSKSLPKVLLAPARIIYIAPWVFTASIVVVLWRLILDPAGVLNFLLLKLHVISDQIAWLSEPSLALAALILINTWAGYPFVMVSLLAGLQGVPGSLYEAARTDGAGPWQTFVHITLPQLKPVLMAIGMLDIVLNIQQFPIVWLATGGGPAGATEVLGTFTYKLAFSTYQFAQSATSGVILLIISAAIVFLYVRHQNARD